jgi:predicted dehydrogenase
MTIPFYICIRTTTLFIIAHFLNGQSRKFRKLFLLTSTVYFKGIYKEVTDVSWLLLIKLYILVYNFGREIVKKLEWRDRHMDEIRLGTIGTGMIVHAILKNVNRTEGIRLAAVYSRKEETGRELADTFGGAKVYTDMKAFLDDNEINTVYIASPNMLHYEQAKQALLAGKNVLCEKPFCTRLTQAQELAELAKSRKLFLMEAVPTTFLPNYQVLQEKLPEIGKVKLVIGNYSQYSSRYDRLLAGEVPNVFNPAYGGGCLMDINFYNAYLCVALFGTPNDAVYYPNLFDNLCDTSGVLMLQYDNFIGTLAGAKDTCGVNSFQIEGENGYIYVKDGSNGIAEVRVVTKTSDETFQLQEEPDRWFYEVQNLTKILLNENHEAVEQRLAITINVVALLESVRTKAEIYFPGDDT